MTPRPISRGLVATLTVRYSTTSKTRNLSGKEARNAPQAPQHTTLATLEAMHERIVGLLRDIGNARAEERAAKDDAKYYKQCLELAKIRLTTRDGEVARLQETIARQRGELTRLAQKLAHVRQLVLDSPDY